MRIIKLMKNEEILVAQNLPEIKVAIKAQIAEWLGECEEEGWTPTQKEINELIEDETIQMMHAHGIPEKLEALFVAEVLK